MFFGIALEVKGLKKTYWPKDSSLPYNRRIKKVQSYIPFTVFPDCQKIFLGLLLNGGADRIRSKRPSKKPMNNLYLLS